MRPILLRIPPSDCVVFALLVVAGGVAAVGLAPGEPLQLIQCGLLLGWTALVAVMMRWERWPGVQYLRPLATVGVIFTCYTTLGKLGLAALPYVIDGPLSRLDELVFRVDPSLAIQRIQTSGWVEFFSFAYGGFIPYVYLSMILGCLGRPPLERDQFLTGWVITYAVSYLGYLFLPARGPVDFHAADYSVALSGGFFYRAVLDGVTASGGAQGAFPSLHVGASVYLCLFDLQTNRLRGLTFLPLVLLIYVATVFLRYHYVVDLIAGTVIAVGCIPLGRRVFLHWAQRRVAAGLPALPGGEADDLPALSDPGSTDAMRLLQAH